MNFKAHDFRAFSRVNSANVKLLNSACKNLPQKSKIHGREENPNAWNSLSRK